MRALRQSSRASTPPMRVLEIGAVNTQLLDAEGLLVRAIDLHSLEPRIETCDFLSLAHGATVDPATGRVQLYDAVVCSMVLNCVPNERKRFDMLVGIRSQLRRGGRAFVTIPRTCLTHSFTLSEPIFVDALASVGLRCLDEVTAAKPPESAKIAYFECEATMPCAEAALRCQRSRFEARKAHRAAADTPTAVLKRKSAGASFDVDVGGHLGFGVRVPRSFDGRCMQVLTTTPRLLPHRCACLVLSNLPRAHMDAPRRIRRRAAPSSCAGAPPRRRSARTRRRPPA